MPLGAGSPGASDSGSPGGDSLIRVTREQRDLRRHPLHPQPRPPQGAAAPLGSGAGSIKPLAGAGQVRLPDGIGDEAHPAVEQRLERRLDAVTPGRAREMEPTVVVRLGLCVPPDLPQQRRHRLAGQGRDDGVLRRLAGEQRLEDAIASAKDPRPPSTVALSQATSAASAASAPSAPSRIAASRRSCPIACAGGR